MKDFKQIIAEEISKAIISPGSVSSPRGKNSA